MRVNLKISVLKQFFFLTVICVNDSIKKYVEEISYANMISYKLIIHIIICFLSLTSYSYSTVLHFINHTKLIIHKISNFLIKIDTKLMYINILHV